MKNNQEELVMYIILNKDLHMSTGKAAAQAGHVVAVYMNNIIQALLDELIPFPEPNPSAPRNTQEVKRIQKDQVQRHIENNKLFGVNHCWMNSSQPKIVLQAHQNQLEKLSFMPGAYHIIDEGRTEIQSGSLTAVCFNPMPRSAAPKILKRLQLYND